MSAPRASRGTSSRSDSQPSAAPAGARLSDTPHPQGLSRSTARRRDCRVRHRFPRAMAARAARAAAGLLLALAVLLALPAALQAQEATWPPTPTDFTAVPGGAGKVTLSWTTPGDGGSPITKHEIRQQHPYQNFWVDIPNSAAGGTNANSYTVSNLIEDGTNYQFFLRARNAIGVGNPTNPAGAKAGTVPPAPTNFVVEPGDRQVSLTWTTTGSGSNPIIYHMRRHQVNEGGFGGWAVIPDSAPGEANANSYTILNLHEAVRTLASQVLAVNSTGRGEPSSEVSVTVVSTDATLSNLSLSDGTLTPAFASGTTSYTASVGNAVSQITVTPTKSDTDASVEYLDGSDATITDADGMTTGQQVDLDVGANTIKVKVTAGDAMTTETYTVTVTRTTTPGPPQEATKPPIPTNLMAVAGAGKVGLSWTTPGDGGFPLTQHQYREKVGSVQDERWHVIPFSAAGEANGNSWNRGGRVNGVTYTYQVRAVNAEGVSGASNLVTATPWRVPYAHMLWGDAYFGYVLLRWAGGADGGFPLTKHQGREKVGLGAYGAWTDIANSGVGQSNEELVLLDRSYGTAYTYQVRAVNEWGAGDESNEVTVTPVVSVPYKPANLVADPGNGSATLRWKTSSFDGRSPITKHQFRDKEGTESYGSWSDIPNSAAGEANANRYTVSPLDNGTAYTFQMRAVNAEGESDESDEASATPMVNADATLSNLSLSDGTLTPAFASGTTSYTASVGNAVSQITVTPTKSDTDASVEYLDGSDATITDADGMTTGQQVDLDVGANTIKVKVTAGNAMTTETYTVTVTRATPPGPPTVSIAADTEWVREGEAAAFTLSRTGEAAAALMVSVSVEQEGDFIDGAKPTSVTFGAGDPTVALEIATVDDEVGEDNGSITVTVTSVPSGTEISQTAASATLEVTDQADTRATVSVDQAAVTVKESAGTVTLGFSARMEPNVTPFAMTVSASTILGTARFNEDYESLGATVTFAAADFQMESGRLVAHKTLDVTILNNHAGRWEGDETFTFKVDRSTTLPATVIFVDQDGDKVSNVTTTITIADDEAPPSLDLSVAPSFVEEGDTATVKVTSANGSAFAEDQTINLSFSGTAARGADYTVGDDALNLGAGLTEVTTTVVVLDDSIDDDVGETIVIEAAHAGTSFSQTYTLVIGGLAPTPTITYEGREPAGGFRVKVTWSEAVEGFMEIDEGTGYQHDLHAGYNGGPGVFIKTFEEMTAGLVYTAVVPVAPPSGTPKMSVSVLPGAATALVGGLENMAGHLLLEVDGAGYPVTVLLPVVQQVEIVPPRRARLVEPERLPDPQRVLGPEHVREPECRGEPGGRGQLDGGRERRGADDVQRAGDGGPDGRDADAPPRAGGPGAQCAVLGRLGDSHADLRLRGDRGGRDGDRGVGDGEQSGAERGDDPQFQRRRRGPDASRSVARRDG